VAPEVGLALTLQTTGMYNYNSNSVANVSILVSTDPTRYRPPGKRPAARHFFEMSGAQAPQGLQGITTRSYPSGYQLDAGYDEIHWDKARC
jgi:hypothetical protein